MPSYWSSMRHDKNNAFLLKSYPFYMKYKQHLLFGGHFGRHLEFQYEESRSRLDTQARKFAYCIIFNIKTSNLFSGGGGTKNIFYPTGFCTDKYSHLKLIILDCMGVFAYLSIGLKATSLNFSVLRHTF